MAHGIRCDMLFYVNKYAYQISQENVKGRLIVSPLFKKEHITVLQKPAITTYLFIFFNKKNKVSSYSFCIIGCCSPYIIFLDKSSFEFQTCFQVSQNDLNALCCHHKMISFCLFQFSLCFSIVSPSKMKGTFGRQSFSFLTFTLKLRL